MAPPRFRFAPSPNGLLHLGHAYSALFAAARAHEAGGELLLRLEDIDPVRCKPEFAAAILEDLAWLGISWAEPVLRQSTRMPAYADAARTLRRLGLLYPCFCSRREVVTEAQGRDPDRAPLYPGTCRTLPTLEAAERMARGVPAQWRIDIALAAARIGPLRFREGEGVVAAEPTRWGDAVLVRKDTPTSYHLSVVVDDAAQAITHVTRGQDLFPATDLHVLLQAVLGLPQPHYRHHRLLTDDGGDKLAKSRGSASLRDLREQGWTPARVRARLGFG